MKDPNVASSPVDGQVYDIVPLEDLNEFDRVDTSHFVSEPTLDSLEGLANFVLGSLSEFLFLFEDLDGVPVLSGIVFAVTTPDGVGRAILPAHDRIVSSVWDEVCKRSSSTSRERLSVVCAEVLVERGTAFMSAYTDALPIGVARKLRGKHNGREVTAQYVLGNYGLMPQEAVKAHVVGVSADFMVSDAVKVLYRKDSEAINPVSVGRQGWALVLLLGRLILCLTCRWFPSSKTPLSVWLWRILLLRVLLALRLCPSFRMARLRVTVTSSLLVARFILTEGTLMIPLRGFMLCLLLLNSRAPRQRCSW